MKQIFKTTKPNNNKIIKTKRKYIKDSDNEEEGKPSLSFPKCNIGDELYCIPNKMRFIQFLNNKKFANVFDFNENKIYAFNNMKTSKYSFPGILPKLVNLNDLRMDMLLPIFKNPYFSNIMRHYKMVQEFNYGSVCSYITLFPLLLDINMLFYFINAYNAFKHENVFSRLDDLLNNFNKNCKSVLSSNLYNKINQRMQIQQVKTTPWGDKYNVYLGLPLSTIIEILDELGLCATVWRVSNINPSKYKLQYLGNPNYPLYLIDMSDGHMEVNHKYSMPYFMSYNTEFSRFPKNLIPFVNHVNELPIENQKFVNEFIVKEKKRNRALKFNNQNYSEPITYYEAMRQQNMLDDPCVMEILEQKMNKLWEDEYVYGIKLDEDICMERRFNPRNNRGRRISKIRPIMRRVRRRIRNNNRRLKRKVNNKINNIKEKLFDIDKKISNKSVIYTKPKPLHISGIQNLYKSYSRGVYNYILSLIKPELAVNGKFIAKQPAFINIPTSNVCFKEQLNIKLDSMNNFYMFWVPNYLSTEYSLQKHLANLEGFDTTYRSYSHLYYTDGTSAFNNWFLHTSYLPKINLSKYRLVSAKCVMQYNGTIMNQQGQFHSCAIYNDLPVFIGRASVQREDISMSRSNLEALMGDDFNLPGFCDIELVRNGLWNKYINITTNSRSLENIALPTDPTDHTFFPMSHYYAKEPPKITEPQASAVDTYYSYAKSSDGGHLSYLYTCQNMNRENGYITVIIYYNFEIIPDQSTAPFLRSKKSEEEAKIYSIVKNSGLLEKVQELISNQPKVNIDKNTLASLVRQAIMEGQN